jgi:hypothetical protein
MTDETIERAGIIAQLIQLHRDNRRFLEIQTATLIQLNILNMLTTDLLNISGGNAFYSDEKLKKQMERVMTYVMKLIEDVDKYTSFPQLVEKELKVTEDEQS